MAIISASRRTDIPAFYSDWLFNRLEEGYVLVRNQYNIRQVSKVRLTPDVVDCLVFWTKNPRPMLERHGEQLRRLPFPFYFQFTITPYGNDIEPGVPAIEETMETFVALSKEFGKRRMVWRYDPILLTDTIDIDWHISRFAAMTERLAPFADQCIISFIDFYKKMEAAVRKVGCHKISTEDMRMIAREFSAIATSHNLPLATCAEAIDLSEFGIAHASCIDAKRIEGICGGRCKVGKDKSQRKECGCVESIDIGAYSTCRHRCLYCYANHNPEKLTANSQAYNPDSPILCSNISPEDKITLRPMKRSVDKSQDLLL